MRSKIINIWIILPIIITTCLEPVDLDQIAQESILVVDALITDQPVKQRIVLSRTVPFNQFNTNNPVSGATIFLIEDNSTQVAFQEIEPGIYETEEIFSAQKNHNYHLRIQTADGNTYESDPSSIITTPPIDSLYAEFEPHRSPTNAYGGFFNFYIDASQNTNNHQYFRWIWNSTYEIHVSNPARWLWLGGVDFLLIERGSPNDSLQREFCWSTDTSKTVNIRKLIDGESEIRRQLIHRFHSDSGYTKIRYSIIVKQYAISEDSYRYWNLIKESGSGGFLFDAQVGAINGNIRNIDKSETVLGYFEVVQEQSVRKFYVPADFHNDLYYELSYFIRDCTGEQTFFVPVHPDSIAAFIDKHGFNYELAYFAGSGPSFGAFLRKECTNCLLYGDTNQKPDFW